jgi:ABC-type sugar transport system substrate-binding protein
VLIGVDGSKIALDGVRAGTLTATLFQDVAGQGTLAGRARRNSRGWLGQWRLA